MAIRESLVGQRFGRLTVVEQLSPQNDRGYIYRCVCDCGRERVVPGYKLKAGRATQCKYCTGTKGDYQSEKYEPRNRWEDLTGQHFGMLTVAEMLPGPNDHGKRYRCICACGGERLAFGWQLKSGVVIQCEACSEDCRKHTAPSGNRRSLVGRTFGKLTVEELLPDRSPRGTRIYRCRCECGNYRDVAAHKLSDGRITQCERCSGRAELTGRTFGRLTVEELLPERGVSGSRVYRCRCECGNRLDLSAHQLISGKATECEACAAAEGKAVPRRRGPRVPDPEPGQVINEWTVLEPCDRNSNGTARWLCRCSCGKERKLIKQTIYQQETCGHARRWTAIQGKRFGRLVIIHPIQRRDPGYYQVGLFRCDCGGVRLAKINSVKQGLVKSCGCLLNWKHAGKARCPSCGHAFPITLDGNPTPQFCPDCAPKYAGKNWRVCPICKTLFQTPPSSLKNTCSPECSVAWNSMLHSGIDPAKSWSGEVKDAAKTIRREAIQQSPIAGRFETNKKAKIWTLVDPTGREYEVRNLMLWARENAELFGKEPSDKSGSQIAHGFIAVAQTLQGNRKSPSMSYFGWTLKEPPRDPDES